MGSVSIGIVGLPNVGKSTLFNALTDGRALAANYPFATIEPNTGVVPIPDPRLNKLAELYKSQKIVPATVQFVDIAGLVEGASQGEGLGNQFLSHIRSVNAICHVVRTFDDPNVVHFKDINQEPWATSSDGGRGAGEQRTEMYRRYDEGAAQPETKQSAESTSGVASSAGRQADAARALRDIEIVNTELVLADSQTIEKRVPKLQKEAKSNPKLISELEALEQIKAILDNAKPLFASSELKADSSQLEQLQLLTAKPVIYVFNVDEESLSDQSKKHELDNLIAPGKAIFICAKLEAELQGLDEADAKELLGSYGQAESGLQQLIHAAYDILNLQSFLTAGEKEVRAWTIPKRATAPEAAGVIHTDFQRGFIAAQVVDYDDLIAAGSESAARAAGKIRTEGKTYIMRPNDVVEFRFNV